jgi:hypothetical protein
MAFPLRMRSSIFSVVALQNMLTTPLPPHFTNIDPTRLWADYYYYKNAVHEDSNDLSNEMITTVTLRGGDFNSIFGSLLSALLESLAHKPNPVGCSDSTMLCRVQ